MSIANKSCRNPGSKTFEEKDKLASRVFLSNSFTLHAGNPICELLLLFLKRFGATIFFLKAPWHKPNRARNSLAPDARHYSQLIRDVTLLTLSNSTGAVFDLLKLSCLSFYSLYYVAYPIFSYNLQIS